MAGASPRLRVLGLILIVAVTVVAVVTIIGQRKDDGDASSATTTTASPATTAVAPGPDDVSVTSLPDGDYGPICTELSRQSAGFAAETTVAAYRLMLQTVDFDALIAASNDWLRPSVETLKAGRDQVLASLNESSAQAQVDPAAFPPDFTQALRTLVAVAVQKCKLG
jgi:hypothetical protein